MHRRADSSDGSFVAGAIAGLILASILAIPFYGLAPLLAVLGALLVLAIISRIGK